jgi:hypothetical protein
MRRTAGSENREKELAATYETGNLRFPISWYRYQKDTDVHEHFSAGIYNGFHLILQVILRFWNYRYWILVVDDFDLLPLI